VHLVARVSIRWMRFAEFMHDTNLPPWLILMHTYVSMSSSIPIFLAFLSRLTGSLQHQKNTSNFGYLTGINDVGSLFMQPFVT
jgi:hypothetical protein